MKPIKEAKRWQKLAGIITEQDTPSEKAVPNSEIPDEVIPDEVSSEKYSSIERSTIKQRLTLVHRDRNTYLS